MAASSWTAEDERVLAAHFPRVGASWDGWAALLPDHGPRSIAAKASELGLSAGGWQGSAPISATRAEIMRMFRNGFAPSRIDMVLNMRDGYAHDLVVDEWRIEKESFGSHF